MQSRSDNFVKDLTMFTDNWKESRVLPTKYLKQEEPSKEFRNLQCDRIYVFFSGNNNTCIKIFDIS